MIVWKCFQATLHTVYPAVYPSRTSCMKGNYVFHRSLFCLKIVRSLYISVCIVMTYRRLAGDYTAQRFKHLKLLKYSLWILNIGDPFPCMRTPLNTAALCHKDGAPWLPLKIVKSTAVVFWTDCKLWLVKWYKFLEDQAWFTCVQLKQINYSVSIGLQVDPSFICILFLHLL